MANQKKYRFNIADLPEKKINYELKIRYMEVRPNSLSFKSKTLKANQTNQNQTYQTYQTKTSSKTSSALAKKHWQNILSLDFEYSSGKSSGEDYHSVNNNKHTKARATSPRINNLNL